MRTRLKKMKKASGLGANEQEGFADKKVSADSDKPAKSKGRVYCNRETHRGGGKQLRYEAWEPPRQAATPKPHASIGSDRGDRADS